MVDKITRVASSVSSSPTRVETSLSLAEPDAAWVAHRQSAINTGYQQRKKNGGAGHKRPSLIEADRSDSSDRQVDTNNAVTALTEEEQAERLSGESERIGSGKLDEEVPFGEHVGYV